MFEYIKTGEKYIGKSVNCLNRYNKHISAAKNPNNKEYNSRLHRAIRKHGIEAFSYRIIEECDKENLNEREMFYINLYNSKENGFNNTIGGDYAPTLSKLSDDDVAEIKELLGKSDITMTEIANKFKMAISSISGINSGDIWPDPVLEYPIRKKKEPSSNLCPDCGVPIRTRSARCHSCSVRYNSTNKGDYIEFNNKRFYKNDIKKLLKELKSFTKVANEIGCSRMVVSRFCKKNDISVKESFSEELKRKKNITREDILSLGEELSWDIRKMASNFKITKDTLLIKIKKFNLQNFYKNGLVTRVILKKDGKVFEFNNHAAAAIYLKKNAVSNGNLESIKKGLSSAATGKVKSYFGYTVVVEKNV